MDQNIITSWLKSGLKKPGKTQLSLAEALGIDHAGVNRMLKGQRHLKASELYIAAHYFDEPLPGEKAMSAAETNMDDCHATESADIDSVINALKVQTHKRRAGEVFERDVIGGLGQGGYANELIADGKVTDKVLGSWVFPVALLHNELHVRESDLDIIRVEGDSMLPTLSPGDRVMVNRRHTRPSPDAIYAIDNGLGIVVKRLELVLGSDPIKVIIKSDNPAHGDQTMLAEEIRIIGRVVLKVSRM
jgi:phage repressor protein C with HTH and peptisase S24 domain